MTMRSLTVVLAALATSALGGCTVISSTSSTGSGGGATSTTGVTSTTTSTGGSGGAGGNASTTSTGTAMCDPAYTCVDAIAEGSGNPAELCDGPARMQFDALAACTCTGACATTCKDNACADQDASAECKACLSTPDTGCKKEFDTCVNGT